MSAAHTSRARRRTREAAMLQRLVGVMMCEKLALPLLLVNSGYH